MSLEKADIRFLIEEFRRQYEGHFPESKDSREQVEKYCKDLLVKKRAEMLERFFGVYSANDLASILDHLDDKEEKETGRYGERGVVPDGVRSPIANQFHAESKDTEIRPSSPSFRPAKQANAKASKKPTL